MLAALLATSLVPSFTAHAQYGSGGAAIYRYFDVPNQNPLLPQPPRPPRPQRQYRGYPTEVGYQGLGFCKGVVNGVCGLGKLAYAAGDLTYGAVQCAGMAVGCGAYALGAVDDPARLVPANPGSLQSGILTSYDDSCKNGEAVKAYGGAVINIATCGIIPLYEAFKDTCETGSDEAMQAIGGAAVGLVPVTRVVGPLVRPWRPSRPPLPPAPTLLPVRDPLFVMSPTRPGSPFETIVVYANPEPFVSPVEYARPSRWVLGTPIEPNLPGRVTSFDYNFPNRIYEYNPAVVATEIEVVQHVANNAGAFFDSVLDKLNDTSCSRTRRKTGIRVEGGGRWSIMYGPRLPLDIGPARISETLLQETGSSNWYLMEYAPGVGRPYHFAYNPTLNWILLHYFKN